MYWEVKVLSYKLQMMHLILKRYTWLLASDVCRQWAFNVSVDVSRRFMDQTNVSASSSTELNWIFRISGSMAFLYFIFFYAFSSFVQWHVSYVSLLNCFRLFWTEMYLIYSLPVKITVKLQGLCRENLKFYTLSIHKQI